MKRRLRMAIDRLLDGELEKKEADRLLALLSSNEQAQRELMIEQRMVRALAELPKQAPESSLLPKVRKALEEIPPAVPMTWRFRLTWAALGVVLGAVLLFGASSLLWRPEKEPVPPGQSVCRLRGASGEVLHRAGENTSPVEVGERLHPGDVVLTGLGSRAEVDIDQDARLVIYQESDIEVEQLSDRVRTFGLRDGRAVVELLDGGLRAVRVRPRGMAVVAEGRIGAFAAMVPSPGRVAFAVLRGSVSILDGAGSLRLPSGSQLKLVSGSPIPRPETVPVEVWLSLTEPSSPLLSGKRMTVAGTSDSHARVWVNGKRVPLDRRGEFRTELSVDEGEIIEVFAEDLVGNTKRIEIGPLVSASSARPAGKKVEAKSYKVTW